jgi:hypothetical protein
VAQHSVVACVDLLYDRNLAVAGGADIPNHQQFRIDFRVGGLLQSLDLIKLLFIIRPNADHGRLFLLLLLCRPSAAT